MSRKVAALFRKYPYLEEAMQKLRGKSELPITIGSIVEKKANPNLLYTYGSRASGNGSYVCSSQRKNQIGTEFVFLAWENEGHPNMLFPVMEKQRMGQWADFWIRGRVSSVAVIETVNWYNETGTYECGSLVASEAFIKIYRVPDGGWDELVKSTSLSKNVYLYTDLMLSGIFEKDPETDRVIKKLGALAKRFNEAVYRNELDEIVEASEMKGMSSKHYGIKMLTYAFIGRVIVTLSRDKTDITFGAEEGLGHNMGWVSVNGTFDDAEAIVDDVIRRWQELSSNQRRSLHRDDTKVGMF